MRAECHCYHLVGFRDEKNVHWFAELTLCICCLMHVWYSMSIPENGCPRCEFRFSFMLQAHNETVTWKTDACLFSLSFLYVFSDNKHGLLISYFLSSRTKMYMHVGGQLPIRLFSLCCALVQLLTEDVRRHILFDQSAFVGAVSLRSAWCVRALIFIQTFSVFCNHGA